LKLNTSRPAKSSKDSLDWCFQMLKFYKAGAELAKRLDRIDADYQKWQNEVQELAQIFGAFGHVRNSTGQVIGLMFKGGSGSPAKADLKLYRKEPVTFDDGKYWIPLRSSKRHAELLSMVFDLRGQMYEAIGFDRSKRLLEPKPGVENVGGSWIIKCDNEGSLFDKPTKWKEFVPPGCSRVSDVYVERLRKDQS
jgi:hypothetical protein